MKIAKHHIDAKNARQLRALKMIKSLLPADYIEGELPSVVFFAEPKNRLAIALKKTLHPLTERRLEYHGGVKLIKYNYWSKSGKLSTGGFEY
ncbi:MAG: hypothetical protein MPJ22_00440 [Pirellulales bacterium]|nr:hypothetical protein [Pirellulales bacterium]